MKTQSIPTVLTSVALAVTAGIALAAQDRFTVKVPDGLSFAEFRGYETWRDVAVSETESSVKAILANHRSTKARRPDKTKLTLITRRSGSQCS